MLAALRRAQPQDQVQIRARTQPSDDDDFITATAHVRRLIIDFYPIQFLNWAWRQQSRDSL
jgi:hypothetical protein